MERDINTTKILGDWIPQKVVKEFFGYGNTRMSTFAKDYNIKKAKVGRRIFYRYSDILRVIRYGIEKDSY